LGESPSLQGGVVYLQDEEMVLYVLNKNPKMEEFVLDETLKEDVKDMLIFD
jgi:hypothetical protein